LSEIVEGARLETRFLGTLARPGVAGCARTEFVARLPAADTMPATPSERPFNLFLIASGRGILFLIVANIFNNK